MRFIFFIILATISGCASNSHMYNPDGLPIDQLAKVVNYKTKWIEAQHNSFIVRVFDESSNAVVKRSFLEYFLRGDYKSVSLKPGKYYFVFKCHDGYTYAYPRSLVELEAEAEYTVFCERIIEEGGGILGLDKIVAIRARVVISSDFSPEIIEHTKYKKE